MDYIEDIFESSLSLEETHFKEGYDEGHADGLLSGKEEGYQVGLKTGFEVGEELGFYRGCINVWNSAIRIDPACFSVRIQKTIKQMEELLHKYPISDPEHDVMWDTLAEEQNQHFSRLCQFWGEDQAKMEPEPIDEQLKQERLRTRWTPALDKIFADIVVKQIQLGNRANNVFDKKTWNQIREEFNGQTNLSFNNNQLRKHLDVLRTRYHNLQSAFNHSDAMQDPCFMGFDLWDDIGELPKTEPTKTKDCPIYEQLCTIFADSGVDGKYAQSSHYEELDKSAGNEASGAEGGNPCIKTPSTSKFMQGNGSSSQIISQNTADKKRESPTEASSVPDQSNWNQESNDMMAKALLDMITSSKLRTATNPHTGERFPITECINALDEIEGIEDHVYYAALNLFENPNFRETFLSLNNNGVRLAWLQRKCASFSHCEIVL